MTVVLLIGITISNLSVAIRYVCLSVMVPSTWVARIGVILADALFVVGASLSSLTTLMLALAKAWLQATTNLLGSIGSISRTMLAAK